MRWAAWPNRMGGNVVMFVAGIVMESRLRVCVAE